MERAIRITCLVAALALLGWVGFNKVRERNAQPTVERALPYGDLTNEENLDLYLASGRDDHAPLVAIVDSPDADSAFGETLAIALAKARVNAAVVRIPSSGNASHIAKAISFLGQNAAAHHGDADRIFLLGHGASGELVSSVALQADRYGLKADDLAGVILIGAAPDTSAIPPKADNQPPFFLLSGENDPAEDPPATHRFADALRASGNTDVLHIVATGRNYAGAAPWDGAPTHLGHRLLLSFLDAASLPEGLLSQLNAERRWRETPPHSTEPFWITEDLVKSYPIDDRLIQSLQAIFTGRKNLLRTLPLQQYHSVDLLDYLHDNEVSSQTESHLVVTNLQNQQLVLSREQLQRLRPQLVIGLDDERNLFRYGVGYHSKKDYSWKPSAEGPRPQLIRPLGAFLHLPDAPASRLFAPTLTRFALHAESFRWKETDPLAAVNDLDPKIRNAFTKNPACLECHSYKGAGPQSHHLDAFSGQPRGGNALPLEDYPPGVLSRFLLEQEIVAKEIGATPVSFEPGIADKLLDFLVPPR